MHFDLARRLTDRELARARGGRPAPCCSRSAATVTDFGAMTQRVEAMIALARKASARYDSDEVREAVDFLAWLLRGNFVLLGAREYEIKRRRLPLHPRLRARHPRRRGALGLRARRCRSTSSRTRCARWPLDGELLIVDKANARSPVHRHERMDYVGVRRVTADGEIAGESRLLGLFTTKAYAEPASETPVLHRKLRRVLEAEDLIEGSHDYKSAVALFDTFPKDELFAAPVDDLRRAVVALLALEGTDRVRLLGRRAADGRSASFILALPRDRYRTLLVERVRKLFMRRFGDRRRRGPAHARRGPRACACTSSSTRPTGCPRSTNAELEREVVQLARTWDDALRDVLVERFGAAPRAAAVLDLGSATCPSTTRATRRRRPARRTSRCSSGWPRTARSWSRCSRCASHTRVALYKRGPKVELGDALPMLEDLGLRVIEEISTRLVGEDETWVQEFRVLGPDGEPLDLDALGDRVAELLAAVHRGEAETDPLNRLVITAGLDRRQVAILRAYRKYRQRVGSRFTESYQNDVLVANSAITAKLVRYFELRFDPDARDRRGRRGRAARRDPRRPRRGRLARPRPDPAQPADRDRGDAAHQRLQPRPRGAGVQAALGRRAGDAAAGAARGDLRLLARGRGHPPARRPDRPRRPALVGPAGLPHRGLRADARAADQERGDRPRGRQGRLLPQEPADRARRAARPRSSASTSPTSARCCRHRQPGRRRDRAPAARARARRRRHLPGRRRRQGHGDVLGHRQRGRRRSSASGSTTRSPSGGSAGYDHKALGITAKGAWESVKRHFKELGVDTQADEFTVVGIGDMSGDVFGNGMLLSEHIRLVAAYDHRHVFIDPAPDAATGFAERRRLFELAGLLVGRLRPRADLRGRRRLPAHREVDPALAAGARGARHQPTSRCRRPRSSARSCARPSTCSGTAASARSVKASTETDADAARPLSATRSASTPTSCARRSSARAATSASPAARGSSTPPAAGAINADFIDNSAGVDCSDHEVNLKILLGLAERRGELTRAERDELLFDVTEDVVEHVLYDSFLQAQIIAQEVDRSASRMFAYEDLMTLLEENKILDRAVRGPADERRRSASAGAPAAAWSGPSSRCSSPTPSGCWRGRWRRRTSSRSRGWSATCASTSRPPVVKRFGHLLAEHPLRAPADLHGQLQPGRQLARADVRLAALGRARRRARRRRARLPDRPRR